ncbi:Dicer-like protein 2 [Aspergillus terreus]
MIESNMNAICKTPRAHRQELLTHTHRPHLQQIWYTPVNIDDPTSGTRTLRALIHAWETIDLEDDPYVKQLRRSTFDGKALQKALLTRKTYCNESLRRFVERSCHIFQELGGWAVDYFIHASIRRLREKIDDSALMLDWDNEEKEYLASFLSNIATIQSDPPRRPEDFIPSPKLEALISFLSSTDDSTFSGLIFAKQRATVTVLATLLSVHPLTKDRFRCAAFVGWSGGGNRKDLIGELLSMQMQRDTLSEFRSGQKNLIVATDVLEEGIDISACSVVICYDKPANVKSFVQRRGRARRKESTFAILFSTDDELCDLRKWQLLEEAMIEAYQDDERKRCEALALETMAEVVTERFEVESTGPELSFEYDGTGRRRGTFKLPSCVHPDVRRTRGEKWWTTERAATKEAAFQTCKRLYEFGLLNDHLLPLTRKPELRLTDFGGLPSIIEVAEQYDPWTDWAYSWSSPDIHQSRIRVQLNGNPEYQLSMSLMGPTVLPALDAITLFWDSQNIFTLAFDAAQRVPLVPGDVIEHMRAITALYLQAPSSRSIREERDYVALFGPDLPHTELGAWLLKNGGNDTALDVYSRQVASPTMGIVRDRTRYDEPLLFKKWVVTEDGDVAVVEMECHSFPKRRNLLQRQTLVQGEIVTTEVDTGTAKARIIPATACTIDRLPFTDTIFGLFISAILDRLEATLIATRLCETILQDVQFSSTRHVITAISAPTAQSPTDYQRYEFFGDSVLKFTVSCQLYMQHPNWPEGYLSEGRDEIVQNNRLARAALDVGLDAFILTRRFTPRKWTAPLISEKAVEVAGKRPLSSKVLADVVESLIGAAYMDGGQAKAHTCIRRLLPEIEICPITPPPVHESAPHVMNDSLKQHLGYTFVNEALLVEALTHPSCRSDASTQSYQRLEFLGDAVLDMVVVHAMAHHAVECPQGEMTMIKHALTNANLLAFFCMEFVVAQEHTDVDAVPAAGGFALRSEQKPIELWRFMRSEALDLNNARETVLHRHSQLRAEIVHALHHGAQYPWQALSQLNADKFFSDIVESILGAIFVDSRGDLDVCAMFVERIGLLPYLRRILADRVDVTHPRHTAQRLSKGEALFTAKRVVDGSGNASYRCVVKRNKEEIVVVEGCLSSEEAEVKAANATIGILRANAVNLV